MQKSMHGSLTVRPADFRTWLLDIGSKFADTHSCEAAKASSSAAGTLVYYPSHHSSDLIWNSFIDLWGYWACYFDPYLAITCPTAIRKGKGSKDSAATHQTGQYMAGFEGLGHHHAQCTG